MPSAPNASVSASTTVGSEHGAAGDEIVRRPQHSLPVRVGLPGGRMFAVSRARESGSLLFVDLRQFEPSGPEKPSRRTQELGKQLAQLIHERFPAAKLTQGNRLSGLLAP